MNAKNLTHSAQTSKPVPQAVEALTEALKQQGFSVLVNINVTKIIKEKTGKTIDDYVILEVCNANDASYALFLHKEIGLMLPCKLVIYKDSDATRILLYRPTEALKQLELSDLTALAEDVEAKLKRAVDAAAA
jgi:uncharacterized protein (DUF302 family)